MSNAAYDWKAGLYITAAYDEKPDAAVIRLSYSHQGTTGYYGGELDNSFFMSWLVSKV